MTLAKQGKSGLIAFPCFAIQLQFIGEIAMFRRRHSSNQTIIATAKAIRTDLRVPYSLSTDRNVLTVLSVAIVGNWSINRPGFAIQRQVIRLPEKFDLPLILN